MAIAGHRLERGRASIEAIYDAGNGYFLYRTAECDGADIGLTLTRDRNMVANEGFFVPGFKPKDHENGTQKILRRRLKNLATNSGIRIGDSFESVRSKMGKPDKRLERGISMHDSRFKELNYDWTEKGRLTLSYGEGYVFKYGRLIEITFWRGSG